MANGYVIELLLEVITFIAIVVREQDLSGISVETCQSGGRVISTSGSVPFLVLEGGREDLVNQLGIGTMSA